MILAAPTVAVPSDPTSTYVILGIAAVFIVYVMMRLTKRKKKDTPFPTRSLAQQRSTERHYETLLVELNDMSRQITAQLDTRAARLETILRDADERIARLEALNAQPPAKPDFAMPPQPTIAPVVEAPIFKTQDEWPAVPNEHAEICRMADDGQSVASIAGALGRPSGEIELILALRPKG